MDMYVSLLKAAEEVDRLWSEEPDLSCCEEPDLSCWLDPARTT